MSARPFYETVYHRDGWTLADAFRPQPGWGMRRFTCPVEALGEHTEDALIELAKDAAPERHFLTSVSLYPVDGDARVLWSTPPDPRFAATQAPSAAKEPRP